MPRKPRIEFPGAIYHILNRGNCRSPIFSSEGAKILKKTVLKDHAEAIDQWKGFEFQEARELYWDNLLDQLLKAANKSHHDIVSDPKSASWKVMIAYYLKTHTAVTNGWISTHLNMGIVQGVSRYVSYFIKHKLYQERDYKDICIRITT